MDCPICSYDLQSYTIKCPRCEYYYQRGISAAEIQTARAQQREHELELTKVQAHIKQMGHKSRVKRTKIICGSALGSVSIICALLAYEHTASVVHIIEAVTAALATLTLSMISGYRIYMANVRKNHRRIVLLEKQLDRRRTSSLTEQSDQNNDEDAP